MDRYIDVTHRRHNPSYRYSCLLGCVPVDGLPAYLPLACLGRAVYLPLRARRDPKITRSTSSRGDNVLELHIRRVSLLNAGAFFSTTRSLSMSGIKSF
ncbi:hypothetical protein RRG08_023469 [Elysia crispata]|uniref:Uncharacterized protein n=1 Tax=Elysia crispata TaxID=231223 RepID=A0AAE1AEC7_9GAST|nr:hypothetical protein RRG08_023469 [Elysia crispata]